MISGPEAILALSIANVAVWLLVTARTFLFHRGDLELGVRTGAIVGVIAGAIGGLVTSFGFLRVLPADWTQLAGASWRAAMLAAGLYALAASVQERRRPR